MSFDIGDPKRYVFYVNFQALGNGTTFAEVTQRFNFAQLIEDSSKYVISVERASIPIQAIPMFPRTPAGITLVPKNAGGPKILDLEPSFSINDFLVQVSTLDPSFIVGLTEDGRLRIDYDDFSNFFIFFEPNVGALFDMGGTRIGENFVGTQTIVGASPIFDRFDDLTTVVIESEQELGSVQQEIVSTDVFNTTLTDFLVESTEGMSYNGVAGTVHNPSYTVNYPVRANLIFNNSASRRFIMLKGTAPVQSIKLSVVAIFKDGSRNQIILPPRSVMTIKLAFWRKA